MSQPEKLDELACLISQMQRPELIEGFLTFRGSFPVDFTPEFLQTTPLDHLRHIYLALCLHAARRPQAA